jgi:hypothetical protein
LLVFSQLVQLWCSLHGAQINFGDLTRYLTYEQQARADKGGPEVWIEWVALCPGDGQEVEVGVVDMHS